MGAGQQAAGPDFTDPNTIQSMLVGAGHGLNAALGQATQRFIRPLHTAYMQATLPEFAWMRRNSQPTTQSGPSLSGTALTGTYLLGPAAAGNVAARVAGPAMGTRVVGGASGALGVAPAIANTLNRIGLLPESWSRTWAGQNLLGMTPGATGEDSVRAHLSDMEGLASSGGGGIVPRPLQAAISGITRPVQTIEALPWAVAAPHFGRMAVQDAQNQARGQTTQLAATVLDNLEQSLGRGLPMQPHIDRRLKYWSLNEPEVINELLRVMSMRYRDNVPSWAEQLRTGLSP